MINAMDGGSWVPQMVKGLLQLRSWSQDSGIKSHIRVLAQWGICFSFSLYPIPPIVFSRLLSLFLSNKVFKKEKRKRNAI